MADHPLLTYTAFAGYDFLVRGTLEEVALALRRRQKAEPALSLLVFSDSTGKQMDLDLRGSESDVLGRLKVYLPAGVAAPAGGLGRPKLGVIAREVSLQPRHWEWLATQSGGASATLRRLIEEARKKPSPQDLAREAQERAHKFMSALAGDLPGYEEALRALYAKNKESFFAQLRSWPKDVREHAKRLAAAAW